MISKLLFFLEALGITVILLAGFVIYLDYKYKAELLLTPCELCAKLNPNLTSCFTDALTVYIPVKNPMFNISLNLNATKLKD